MDLLDFLVFFVWVIIFYFIFSARRKRYESVLLRAYHKKTFWVKVFGTLAFSLFVQYVSPGDTTTLYYPEGKNIYDMILKDFSNFKLILQPAAEFDQALLYDIGNAGFFNQESNFMVTRLVTLFCFLTMGKYLAINLIFSMISFTGVWRLYKFFYELYPDLHRQLAISILYLPTFVFWSSGILKDPLCTGALGWITYSLYHIFYKRNGIVRNLIPLVLFGWLLIIIKVYIIVAYLPFFLLFLVVSNINLMRNKLLKVAFTVVIIGGSVLGSFKVVESLQKALGKFAGEVGISKTIKFYQKNYANQEAYAKSNFSLGVEFDGTPQSLIKMAPAAIVATLYRPFLWESKKLSTLLSSLESLVMMIFTLFVILRVGLFRFLKTIVSHATVMYCMLYSLLFSLFVGATTLNFGSLVRYKIPAMPFYLIALFLILYVNGKMKFKPTSSASTPR